MPRVSINELGNRYGRLLVIEQVSSSYKGAARWLCQCDCGNTSIVIGGNLRNKKDKGTKSCGCLSTECDKNPEIMAKRIAGGFTGRKSGNQYSRLTSDNYCAYKTSARVGNLVFDLSKEDIKVFMEMDCFYCGDAPSNFWVSPITGEEFYWNGIDRLDNSKGYFIENCVPCCSKCNRMKGTIPADIFILQATKITDKLRHGVK